MEEWKAEIEVKVEVEVENENIFEYPKHPIPKTPLAHPDKNRGHFSIIPSFHHSIIPIFHHSNFPFPLLEQNPAHTHNKEKND
ncbi:MAG: hypothetical protein K9G70_03460 [Prolixibacteraceae bacterium]|nr:hypothetical protein [Prolixibacteraceae bacterium]